MTQAGSVQAIPGLMAFICRDCSKTMQKQAYCKNPVHPGFDISQ